MFATRVVSEVTALVARIGYYRRKKRRHLKKYPLRWLTPEVIIWQDLLYIREEDGDRVVGDRFIDVMSSARAALADSIFRRNVISLTIGVYVALIILGVEFPVTLGGFSLKRVPGLTEGLIVLADLIGLSMIARMVNLSVISSAIKGAIAGHIDPSVQYFYRSALLPTELPPFFQPTYLPHITWGQVKSSLSKLYVALQIAFLVALVVGFVAFRLWAFGYIFDHPSAGHAVSVTAIGLTIILDLISFLLIWMFLLPLPHRDWQLLQEMELRDQFSADKGEAFRRDLYREDIEDLLDMQRKGYLRSGDES